MKKFIFMLIAMLSMVMSVNAQSQSNYTGSSKFTDNWSVTLQGGVLTTMDNFFAGHTAMAPTVVLGVDKYINPWLGVGIEGRTLIGTGTVNEARFNQHVVFDAVNVSGYVKFNVLNLIDNLNGVRYSNRKFFEPVVYTGLGWGHQTCGCVTNTTVMDTHTDAARDYMTYRAGAELNFNLGKAKDWAIVVNPSVVWGNICNGRLDKSHANFEVTAGVVYHFKTSNGTHAFTAAKLYDQSAIDELNAKINELKNRRPQVIERVVEVPAKQVAATQTTYVVPFAFDSSEITSKGQAELDKIGQNSIVTIDAYASCEPKSNEQYNLGLTQARAEAVKKYLEGRGVKVDAANFHGGDDNYGRVAIVTMK